MLLTRRELRRAYRCGFLSAMAQIRGWHRIIGGKPHTNGLVRVGWFDARLARCNALQQAARFGANSEAEDRRLLVMMDKGFRDAAESQVRRCQTRALRLPRGF